MLASSCATGGDLAPIAFIWTCRARPRGGDRERVRPVLRRTRGRRHHARRERAGRAHPRLPSRPRQVDGLHAGPAGLLPHHARGRGGAEELSRLASRAILYRLPGLALELQAVGNRLGDALDEEEVVNLAADIPYTVFPCPVENTPYPARATALLLIEPRMPGCRAKADALRTSFAARRTLLQQCLR